MTYSGFAAAAICGLGALFGQMFSSGVARSAEPDAFSGKTVSIATHTAPGGGYDLLARLTAQSLGQFLPGNPRIIVVNMPGAGGLRAFNHAARLAPRDGSYLIIVPQGLTVHEPTTGTGMQASLRDMNWVGNFSKAANVLVVWHTSSINTIEDAKNSEVTVGSTGPASIDSAVPLVLNSVLGTKFRVVYGYPGGSRINLAMERGELHGRGSNTWTSYQATFADAVHGKKLVPLVQVGISKDPAIPDTPLLSDLVRGNPLNEQVAEFLSLAAALSRPVAAPPGVPLDRVALLREAFKKTMNHEVFQNAAQKSGIEIDPMDGEETQRAVDKMLSTPNEVLAVIKAAVSGSQ